MTQWQPTTASIFSLAFVVTTMAGSTGAQAAIKTETVKYRAGDVECIGYLAYDDAKPDKRPGILISPEWGGLGKHARSRAEQLAGLGYVALALDPYGGGKTTTDNKQAAQWSGELKKHPDELRVRANAALDTLRKNDHVDTTKIAAIGYCFGGTTVLELARGGADIRGVVSFHGGLATPDPAKPGSIKAKVLALHGADDPTVPPPVVATFEKEMRDAGADWELVSYGGAVHGFTNPDASKVAIAGVAYNEKADKRSWQAMLDFFHELFGS